MLFTSESVSDGHPDKICDQISDAILDAYLNLDPNARVACETLVKDSFVLIAGEVKSTASVHIEEIVRQVIQDIGYDDVEKGLDAKSCTVMNLLSKQSPHISMGVDQKNGTLGAGDQGLMFGYADEQTEEYMPAPIYYAHQMMRKHREVRTEKHSWLLPDAKCQLTLQYDEDKKIAGVHTIVFSAQHHKNVSQFNLQEAVIEEIIKPTLGKKFNLENTVYHINPTGLFVVGGPQADCGLTGRKIIVDTYGGFSRHGGGAFSGKDPSKVDRSAAYMARYLAKNIVAAGLAKKCEIQISYSIGIAEPINISVETFSTSLLSNTQLEQGIFELFQLTPKNIIDFLNLSSPIFQKTAAFGHFGRKEAGYFPWENLNDTNNLITYFS